VIWEWGVFLKVQKGENSKGGLNEGQRGGARRLAWRTDIINSDGMAGKGGLGERKRIGGAVRVLLN